MQRNNDGEVLFWIVMAGLGLLAIFVYFQVKAFADWIHLDWRSAACMLGGILLLAVSIIVTLTKGWHLGKLLPWMLCGFYPFLLPALNWWSLSVPGRLFRIDNYESSSINGAWYGNGWWQLAMFTALIGAAYSLHKLQSGRY